MPKYTLKQQIELFYFRIRMPQSSNGCWIWRAGKNKKGYGIMRWKGKMTLAHRISYEITHGSIPSGMHVLHSCDNPSCVNPAHLRIGDNAANVADRHKKGRDNPPRGERSGKSKLTKEQVVKIRYLSTTGELSQREISEMFDISQQHVCDIVNRKYWTHI